MLLVNGDGSLSTCSSTVMKTTIETEKLPMPDLGDLERTFKDYTGNLPDYKRREVYAYVNALKAEIAKRDKEIDELSNELVHRSIHFQPDE